VRALKPPSWSYVQEEGAMTIHKKPSEERSTT